jgi:hypothetical protein
LLWTFQPKLPIKWVAGSLRASPPVLSTWSCTVQVDEENRTIAGLAHGIGFSIIRHVAVAGKGRSSCAPTEKSVINMI